MIYTQSSLFDALGLLDLATGRSDARVIGLNTSYLVSRDITVYSVDFEDSSNSRVSRVSRVSIISYLFFFLGVINILYKG